MELEAETSAANTVASGAVNRVVGWTMVLVGLSATVVLDPWYFGGGDTESLVDGLRPMARHAQGVLLAMALLQLAVGLLLAASAFPEHAQRIAAWLTSIGAIIYAAGYALCLYWPQAYGAVLAGSLLNFAGFAYLCTVGPTGPFAAPIRLLLPVACFGMALDFAAGLFLVRPDWPFWDALEAQDAVRLRMLRLARVAAIALSVLTLLYEGVIPSTGRRRGWTRVGEVALVAGAIGMPAILAAACFTSLHLKYLLPLPATAVLIGVGVGLHYAWQQPLILERWGWSLIALSISAGMGMGMYAFAGPLPTPELLGDYSTAPHQRSILAHSYAILLGLLSIFLSRRVGLVHGWRATGAGLVILGSVVTVVVLAVGILLPVPAAATGLGPAVTVVGTALCMISTSKQ